MYIRSKKKGFTLIELIMAVVVAGIISLSLSVILVGGMNAWFFLRGQRSLTAEADNALRQMIREIKLTKNNSDGITAFTAIKYEFKDIGNNAVTYEQESTNLERNNVVLLSDLAGSGGLQFVYLDKNGLVTAVKTSIDTVQVSLKLQKNSNQAVLRSAAAIRNK